MWGFQILNGLTIKKLKESYKKFKIKSASKEIGNTTISQNSYLGINPANYRADFANIEKVLADGRDAKGVLYGYSYGQLYREHSDGKFYPVYDNSNGEYQGLHFRGNTLWKGNVLIDSGEKFNGVRTVGDNNSDIKTIVSSFMF